MYKWPDGWREAVIADMGAEQSDFLMKVLQAWQESTPIEPYTNNPLGMPFVRGQYPQLLNSGYAMFPTMPEFRRRFVAFLGTDAGYPVAIALLTAEDLGPVWRAVNGLGWPGNTTETDYPARILDLMTEKVRNKLQTTSPADRKSAGTIGYSAASQGGATETGRNIQRAANAALSAGNALRNTRIG